ncbi:HAMP domain-containing sensor histidine kinase [Pseudarthrobacter sp. PS3-L1]|uniref:sensor histidine kinase n=1 Tax=Pseudarthrobacter sp. PS3-L1 TaxID=3046207 RepID=UPI0024BA067D|nr:HAMP domain-containing sensor histidine kinase [Pseudarthrobacter sp. PS3-L1]MDJ0319372.1 HAMP domain-containing sensor histidine kinase [Pseudarthrobacter sp. PS3-L1]
MSQLVAIIIVLLTVSLTITGATTLTLLHSYLVEQVDAKLKAAVTTAERQGNFSQLQAANPMVPTDYSLVLFRPDGSTVSLAGDKDIKPAIDSMSVGKALDLERVPFMANGTNGQSWRVVAVDVSLATTDGTPDAAVVIGLPLTNVDDVVRHAGLVVSLVGLATLLLAIMAATWTVRRAFQPLSRVEKTAAAIAAGDLSRRVEGANGHTELGRLAGSLNAMLSHIESAFAARTASEDRMRRFAADASHELRTPLVTIRGFSELYRHGALSEDEDVATAMGRIESEAKRMGSMVEDLLLLARIDEQLPLQNKPVDLHLLANDAVVDTQATARGRKVTLVGLQGALKPGPAPVLGDEAKLRQVVGNLVGNALRYTPDGSPIELAVGTGTNAGGERTSIIEVRDHGPGISGEDSRKVFERFYRADTSRTRETGGSGLGLAIVAAIVGSHGGTVKVQDTAGGGATLSVTIPWQADEALHDSVDPGGDSPDPTEVIHIG